MGGGKTSTSTQTVSIPPEVLARYNAVNARAEQVAQQPFQQYGGEFVAPLNPVQQAGIQATSAASQLAQPYYGAAAGMTLAGAQDVGPLTQGQIGYYQNPYTQAVVGSTLANLGQQFGQQNAAQQAQAIKAGAFGGERAGLQRAQLAGQQGLAAAQAIAPLYQQGYQQAVQTAGSQQAVIAQDLARRMQAGQQLAGLGTGAQQAALQGAQAQIGAGTLGQQTQQAQDTALYQQFLQERGYPFQVAQFLANIAEGTGALSGSTTTTTQPRGFFSNRGGFKTGESLQRSEKAYGGGLMPSSMGGPVYEPGAFERGGYATDGGVPFDIQGALAAHKAALAAGPWAGSKLPGIVPAPMTRPERMMQLMKPSMGLKQSPGTGAQLVGGINAGAQAMDSLSKLKTGATEVLDWGKKKIGGTDAKPSTEQPTTQADATPAPTSSNPPLPPPRPKDLRADIEPDTQFAAHGGGIMPREHYLGGGNINPYEQRDPNKGYIDRTMEEQEEDKQPSLKKPDSSPSGPGGGGLGGDLMKAAGIINAGSTLASGLGKVAAFLPTIFAADGGVVPRQHFKGGGFDDAYQTTLQHEGGYTEDTGGPTMMGISSRANPDVDLERVKNDPEYRRDIYKTRYWEPIGAENLDPKLQSVAYDTAVNLGVGRTKQLLSQAEGDPVKLLQLRQQHYDNLVQNDPETYGQYAKGWNSRVNSFARQLGVEPLAYMTPEGKTETAAARQAKQDASSGIMPGAPRTPIGKEQSWGDFLTSPRFLSPLGAGLLTMASSPSRSFGAAALQGLGAGLQAIQPSEVQAQKLEQERLGTVAAAADLPSKYVVKVGNYIMVKLKDGNYVAFDKWVDMGEPPLEGGDISASYAKGLKESLGIQGKPAAGVVPSGAPSGTEAPPGGVAPPSGAPAPAAPAAPKLMTSELSDPVKKAAKQEEREILKLAGTSPETQRQRVTENQQYVNQVLAARTAAENALDPIINASQPLASLAAGGQLTPGMFAPIQTALVGAWNSGVERLLSGSSPEVRKAYKIAPQGLTDVELSQKAKALATAARAENLDVRAAQGMSQLADMFADPTRTAETAASIFAETLVQAREAIDKGNFIDNYRKGSLQGIGRGGDQLFQTQFPKEKYNEERDRLKKLFLQPVPTKNGPEPLINYYLGMGKDEELRKKITPQSINEMYGMDFGPYLLKQKR